MKRFLLIVLLGIFTATSILVAQDQPVSPNFTTTGVFLGETPALRDLPPLTPEEFHQLELKGEQKALNPQLKERHYPYASTAEPKGDDPAWQRTMGNTQNSRALTINFNGTSSPYFPPDANGAAGPNHYMQTINTVYTVFDKSTGATLAGPTALNTLFNGVTGADYNDGDPICLYDEQADRWLVAEFSVSGSNDYMLIAVSTTNDPTGSWYAYSFDVADMPDYEKFGIWQDGYYMGTNTYGGTDIYVFEREQMLTGGTAQAVAFDNPWRPTTIDGFHCVPPVDNDGAFAPAGSPGLFITLNDDAIGGGSDELWIYELDVNWTSPSSSTFNRVQQLGVPAFDSNFGNDWDNIKQPGTTNELDAIPMVIMNVPQYRNFGSYQTLVCCHTVDVDATDHAGIRWYELRRTDGNWTLRQSGTFAPDEHSRWMGSAVMNGLGEIALGYSVSSTTVYPGIRYCGQSQIENAAASGILDIAEEVIQDGSSSQTSYNRWGDYSNMCVDPADDHTFWFTTQYGGYRQTKVAAFEFSDPPLAAEFSGDPTNVCPGGTVAFTDQSTGGPISWNWSFDGGDPGTSTDQNPTVTYNTPGTYDVTLTVSDGTDNSTQTKTGYIIVAPLAADFTGTPTLVTQGNTVAFTDMSTCNPTSWSWSFPGGTPATSTEQNPVVTYNSLGDYSVTLQATGASGTDIETKTDYITVTDVPVNYCSSQGNNSSYEYIGEVQFNDFINSSGSAGYSDFTNLIVPMAAGGNVDVTLTPVFPGTVYVEYWRVWIDYNRDGDFEDAGELAFGADATSSVVTGNFSVPSGVSGNTRMRVSMKWEAAPSPCEAFAYGEVEDYTVSLEAPLAPLADFTADNTNILEGESVNFTDLSTNSPTSWEWTFQGGTPGSYSGNNPPAIVYNTAGTYDVSLTVSNAAGSDTKTIVDHITVDQGTSAYCTSYGNGTDEWIAGVTVNGTPNPSGSSGTTGYQDFTGITFTLDAGNTYDVALDPGFSGRSKFEYWKIWIDFNGDADFLDTGEEVLAVPKKRTTVNSTITIPADLNITTRMRVTMNRNGLSDPCQIFTAGEVEDYTVTIVSAVPEPPVAEFFGSPTTIYTGQSVQFTDQSSGIPTSWNWTFEGGNPSTSNVQNPTVTYDLPDVYNVTLTVTNAQGQDSETKIDYITVNTPPPVPNCTDVVSPADATTGVLVTSILEWISLADATGYVIYFGTDNPPTNVENGTDLGDVTIYDPAGELNYSTTYYWRIVPYNANGNAIGCPLWSFTTEDSPFGSVQLSFSDFENGWGIWSDGGGDCSLYTGGTYASGGSSSIDIQDNSDYKSSFYLTNSIDVHNPGYVQLNVEFEFICDGMENNEDFWVQYYDGSNWNTVETYVSGPDFSNDVFYAAGLSILETMYNFPTDMLIRFMCDASDNNDDVYIDNVKISASTSVALNNYLVPLYRPIDATAAGEGMDGNIRVYPNPASDQLNVEVMENEKAEIYINDIQGRVVYHSVFENDQEVINVQTFRTGIYNILLITPDEVFRSKFVKR